MPEVLASDKDRLQRTKDFPQDAAPKIPTPPSPELPAAEYLAHLIDYRNTGYLAFGSSEHWHTPMFHFVRYLKLHPDFAKLSAAEACRTMSEIMSRWRVKQPTGPDLWAFWFQVARDDAHAEIFSAWDTVRYLPGCDPLQQAVERAKRMPLLPAPEHQAKRPAKYADFLSVAGWLQVTMGNRPIMLPVEKLDKILGVEPMTISRYRKWAIEDKYVKEVRPYEFHGKGKGGKATEFYFDVSRWKCLMEAAAKGTVESFSVGCYHPG
jgi:hypothetical protein